MENQKPPPQKRLFILKKNAVAKFLLNQPAFRKLRVASERESADGNQIFRVINQIAVKNVSEIIDAVFLHLSNQLFWFVQETPGWSATPPPTNPEGLPIRFCIDGFGEFRQVYKKPGKFMLGGKRVYLGGQWTIKFYPAPHRLTPRPLLGEEVVPLPKSRLVMSKDDV